MRYTQVARISTQPGRVLERAHATLVVIIGTMIRDHGVLDVLKEVTFGRMAESGREVKKEIMLEDGTGKVRLLFGETTKDVEDMTVNGMVMGFIGMLVEGGSFLVGDVVFPEPLISIKENPTFNFKLVFVAGLGVGIVPKEKVLLLFNHLQAYAKNTKEPSKLLVFFVGNSLDLSSLSSQDKTAALMLLDDNISKLSNVADVFIIPGLKDPTSIMLPQQPLSRVLLPKSSSSDRFHSETNPARIFLPTTNQKRPLEILLCSGENVEDFMRAVKLDDPLLTAKHLLQSGHLCPTAPNHTAISPGLGEDVFALEQAPNFFVFGNTKKECRMAVAGRTHVVTIPSFAESGQIIIFNNDTVPAFAHF